MGLITLIDTRLLGLTIMLDPKNYGSGERVKIKILKFENHIKLKEM